jgi:hypothetical protein
MNVASARDYGQWETTDPETREWYQALMQPDNPAVSCCGEADAYWADSFEVEGDKYVAIVTGLCAVNTSMSEQRLSFQTTN